MNLLLLLIIWLGLSFGNPDESQALSGPEKKKVDKALRELLQSEDYKLYPLLFGGDSILVQPTSGNTGRFYMIILGQQQWGTLYTGMAKGRYDWFDFIVIFNLENLVEKVEILTYRSDHGFEIMNKSWLKQFNGSSGCDLSYGKNIDAISGATISAGSLTSAIAELCETLKK